MVATIRSALQDRSSLAVALRTSFGLGDEPHVTRVLMIATVQQASSLPLGRVMMLGAWDVFGGRM